MDLSRLSNDWPSSSAKHDNRSREREPTYSQLGECLLSGNHCRWTRPQHIDHTIRRYFLEDAKYGLL